MKLRDYLLSAGRKPWAWGEHDCATFPADWCVARGHPDPLTRWRGTYSTADEARALIDDAGGLVSLWQLGLIEAMIPEVEEAEAGDIGVLAVLGEDGPGANGGIYTGERWALPGPRGIFFTPIEPPDVLKVWRP